MSHTLRSLELTDEITAELTVLVGFDQDLAAEATPTLLRLARHCISVLFARLRDGTFYEPRLPQATAA
jgi:hypothetical protein